MNFQTDPLENTQQQDEKQQLTNAIFPKTTNATTTYDTHSNNNANNETNVLPHQYQSSQQVLFRPFKQPHLYSSYHYDESKNSVPLLPLPAGSAPIMHHQNHDQFANVALMDYMRTSQNHHYYQQQQQQQHHQQPPPPSPLAYPFQFNPDHFKVFMQPNLKYQHQQQPSFAPRKNYSPFKSKFAPYVSESAFPENEANASRADSSTVSTSSSPPLSSSSLNNSFRRHYEQHFNKYAKSHHFFPRLGLNFSYPAVNFMNRAHFSNLASSQTLCRLGASCKFKRENKCKYFHPNVSAANHLKKESKSIEISDYSMENDECESVFEAEKSKSDAEKCDQVESVTSEVHADQP